MSVNGQPTSLSSSTTVHPCTVTNNWAVDSNPFVVSTADAAGTISTTSDLLGRTISYTDAQGQTTATSYDTLGRLSARSGPSFGGSG